MKRTQQQVEKSVKNMLERNFKISEKEGRKVQLRKKVREILKQVEGQCEFFIEEGGEGAFGVIKAALEFVENHSEEEEEPEKDYIEKFKAKFTPGAILEAKDFEFSERETDFLMENQIFFAAVMEEVKEVHLYQMEMPDGEEAGYFRGYPVCLASKEWKGHLTLESCYGFGRENQVITKKVRVCDF